MARRHSKGLSGLGRDAFEVFGADLEFPAFVLFATIRGRDAAVRPRG